MSTASSGPAPRSQTLDADQYDHEIHLVDATNPSRTSTLEQTDDLPASSNLSSPRGSGNLISKRLTKGSLREELARRKYSKWQEGRLKHNKDTGESGDESSIDTARGDDGSPEAGPGGQNIDAEQLVQDTRCRNQRPENGAIHKRREDRGKGGKAEYVIEILYENQRGSFWCGIPLYSHKSLLNFDPSPWQTSSFKDSPVNITNAQVPDPSWEWAWKSWYVDMSQDVDEEGWQYSFSFTRGFAWHGTHPWFHSFCRRRRWLRKRVKKRLGHGHGRKSGMNQAHMLNADYFTIHGNRDRSRGSSAERTANARSSFTNHNGDDTEDDGDLDTMSDIATLMRALKTAPVDRAKLVAVKQFLEQGGDDVFYLADRVSLAAMLPSNFFETEHVQMPQIMSSLIFQNSRRQLLAHLLHVCNAASEHRGEHEERHRPEDDGEERRIDSLLKAVNAADEQVKRLEYWSDVKNVAGTGSGKELAHQEPECQALDGSRSAEEKELNVKAIEKATEDEDEPEAIPDNADTVRGRDIGFEPKKISEENERPGRLEKGKQKE